jgi:hypothetical protein
MGELNRDGLLNSLRDIAGSGSDTKGSFVYDETTLRSLITKWVDLADHYHGSLNRITLGAVKPPGDDFASKALADSANNSGTTYIEYLTRNYWHCIEQAQLLQDTLDAYLGTEHHSVIELTKATDQPAQQSDPNAGI